MSPGRVSLIVIAAFASGVLCGIVAGNGNRSETMASRHLFEQAFLSHAGLDLVLVTSALRVLEANQPAAAHKTLDAHLNDILQAVGTLMEAGERQDCDAPLIGDGLARAREYRSNHVADGQVQSEQVRRALSLCVPGQ